MSIIVKTATRETSPHPAPEEEEIKLTIRVVTLEKRAVDELYATTLSQSPIVAREKVKVSRPDVSSLEFCSDN